jgi:cupin superfamily acireductone dioxygenase involved in methionine salvage
MARDRRYDLEDLANRAGMYFNPQTEVLVIVDDSSSIDSEIFNMEEFEGADWVLISDEVAVDESRRDELLQAFQARHGTEDFEADPDEEPEEYEEEEEELGRG